MSLIVAMCLFALSMSISPGPVNLVTFTSGMNYGFRPSLHFVAGTAFICYMGFKIATAHPELPGAPGRQPHFLMGAALQWLNPKAWVGSLSGISAFEATPGNGLFLFTGHPPVDFIASFTDASTVSGR